MTKRLKEAFFADVIHRGRPWSLPASVTVADAERQLAATQHDGLGTYERQPRPACWCRYCVGIVPHPGGRFSALETASNMDAI